MINALFDTLFDAYWHTLFNAPYKPYIQQKINKTRNDARAELFNYIELFYNPRRRHSNNDGLAPKEFEKRYFEELSNV